MANNNTSALDGMVLASQAALDGNSTPRAYSADGDVADHTSLIEHTAYLPPYRRNPHPDSYLACGNALALANTDASAIPRLSVADALTDRQHDIFQLIVQGLSNKEIARVLKIAQGTVKIHVAALFRKLGVHRRAAVAVAGVRFLQQQAPSSGSPSPAAGHAVTRASHPQHLSDSANAASSKRRLLRYPQPA